jgi:hypothetical protein
MTTAMFREPRNMAVCKIKVIEEVWVERVPEVFRQKAGLVLNNVRFRILVKFHFAPFNAW